MAGDKRPQAKRIKDRQVIASMRLACRSLVDIAEETGLSMSTVKRELKVLQAEWQEAYREDIDVVKSRELRKLERLEAEALAEWERSKKDYQKKTVEERPGKGRMPGGRFAKVETSASLGDPRYLQAILAIHERRAKLLGTDKPLKIAPTNPDGSALSKEHRDAIVAAALAGVHPSA